MLTPSRELVLRKLHDCFGDLRAASDALLSLDSYGTQSCHREKERVQLAILKQCKQSLDRLRELVASANRDYRDVLVGAEYPEEFGALPNTPGLEMAAIRKRDREQYEAWLRACGTAPDKPGG